MKGYAGVNRCRCYEPLAAFFFALLVVFFELFESLESEDFDSDFVSEPAGLPDFFA